MLLSCMDAVATGVIFMADMLKDKITTHAIKCTCDTSTVMC